MRISDWSSDVCSSDLPLRSGDPILPVHATAHEAGAFSSFLSSGRRAITMPVDAINSVSGLLQPGDLIELYVSFEYPRRRLTAPLFQGVRVLELGAHKQYAKDSGSHRHGDYARENRYRPQKT